MSLSLLSTCVMTFTSLETGEKIPVVLRPRSLVVLRGQARFVSPLLALVHTTLAMMVGHATNQPKSAVGAMKGDGETQSEYEELCYG